MEFHMTDSPFGNYLRSPSYPSLALFQGDVKSVPPARRSTLGIHRCVMKGDLDGLKRILSSKKRESINDFDYFGRTALHIALQMANPKALYLLLYYPLVHPSKLFATLDWDHILYESTYAASDFCEIDIELDAPNNGEESNVAENDNVKYVSVVSQGKRSNSEQSAEVNKVSKASKESKDKPQKKRKSEPMKGSFAGNAYARAASSIIKYWEDNPNHYFRAVFGTDHSSNILGCGMKEVEALYEEHYKYLVGEPNSMLQAFRVYSSKYPKLFINHPSTLMSLSHIGDVEGLFLHTRVSIHSKCVKRRRVTSVSTYRSLHHTEAFVNEPYASSDQSDLKEAQSDKTFAQKEVSSSTGSSGNTGSRDPSGKQERGNRSYKGFSVSRLLATHAKGVNGSYIPLVTCDVASTFDKTSPINILFSNIYIESSRDNIYKCYRILLHYFNKFSDCLEGYDSTDDTLYRYKRVVNDLKQRLRHSADNSSTPAKGNTPRSRLKSMKSADPPDSIETQRFGLISLGIPSGPRTPTSGEGVIDHVTHDAQDVNSNRIVRNVVKLPKTSGDDDDAQSKVDDKSFPDAERKWDDLCRAVGNVTGAPSFLFSNAWNSQKNESPKAMIEQKKEASSADLAIDIVDLTLEQSGENVHSSSHQVNIDSDNEIIDTTESLGEKAKHTALMGQTLCTDAKNINAEILNRLSSTIGGFHYGKQLRTHHNCFQIPVLRSKRSVTGNVVISGVEDAKAMVINSSILSSVSWLKPTQSWETFLNRRDYTRANILHRMCEIKDASMIKVLLVSGCMPLVVNEVGDMPVHLAMDAKDPMCLITILDATVKTLFYHKLETVGLYDAFENSERTFISEKPTLTGDKDTPFSKYMNMLNCSIYKNNRNLGVSDNASDVEFTKSHQENVSPDDNTDDGSKPDSTIEKYIHYKEFDVGLSTKERITLLEELILFFEQLTYRGIKAEAWEALIAMFSYNDAITYHLLSNPHYMHRFLNMAVLFGNSDRFISTVNYVVTRIFQWELETSVLHNSNLNNITMKGVTNDPRKGEVSPVLESDDHQIASAQASVPKEESTGSIKEHSYGVPSTALKRSRIGPFTKKTSEALLTANITEKRGRCISSLLQKYRETLPPAAAVSDNKRTWIITHPTCLHHLALPEPTDAPQKRHRLIMTYPENPTRLEVIISNENGILRSDTLENVKLLHSPPPATLADILRVHDWGYINKLLSQVQLAQKRWQTNAYWPVLADGDTPTTPHSWNSALYAAGAVIAAVDAVCSNSCKNAFCAVRPPGHHLGTWGGAQSPNFEDEDFAAGSQGFCLINNVAIGAAYAKYIYANKGIRKIAIVDFDIHHGNGTDQIVQNIGPRAVKCRVGGNYNSSSNSNSEPQPGHNLWFGWRDVNDREEVFFSSIHAYDGLFYPGTGKPCTRYSSSEPCIINVAVPDGTTSPEFRVMFETKILPYLLHFKPDLIFVSAGFDGHYRDSVSSGFTKYTEKDFHWATERLVSVANTVCNGRLVSVLEGGYNTRLDTLSPFAKSVYEHVKALSSTPKTSIYPLMHCENTVDFLISPVVRIDPKSNLTYKGSILCAPSHRALRMKEAIDRLLNKVYQDKQNSFCILPNAFMAIPVHVASMESLAQTDNCFYSFYTRNFWTFFLEWSSLGSIERDRKTCHGNRPTEQKVIAFDRLLGVESNGSPMAGSLLSYVGNTPTLSKLISGYSSFSGSNEQQKDLKELLYKNAWSTDIKMRLLEKHATAAALLLEYFKKNGEYFSVTCGLH